MIIKCNPIPIHTHTHIQTQIPLLTASAFPHKDQGCTLIPPILCSPLNSLPFFSQWMVGVGFPAAAQRNFTVLAAGTANSFFSIRSGRVQYGASDWKKPHVFVKKNKPKKNTRYFQNWLSDLCLLVNKIISIHFRVGYVKRVFRLHECPFVHVCV